MLPCATRQTVEFRPEADKAAWEAASKASKEAYDRALEEALDNAVERSQAEERARAAASEAVPVAKAEAEAEAIAADPEQPVYILAVCGELDARAIRAAITSEGVLLITPEQLRMSLRRVVGGFSDDLGREQTLEALDRIDAGTHSFREPAGVLTTAARAGRAGRASTCRTG